MSDQEFHPDEAPDLVRRIAATYGSYFYRFGGVSPEKLARDVLSEQKVHDQISVLCRYTGTPHRELLGRKMLEIGSGYGVFVCLARKCYGLECVGVEPSEPGFETSYAISREIAERYGMPLDIIASGCGEALPYPPETFDFVFSSNVLEHTQDPATVLRNAWTVLRPGGWLQIVVPNYGSFFEGHYALPWIPYLGQKAGAAWVRLWGRDPSFLRTLNFINCFSLKKMIRNLPGAQVVSFGEELFLERMTAMEIREWAGLSRLRPIVDAARRLGLAGLAARVLIALRAFQPIVLTAQKAG